MPQPTQNSLIHVLLLWTTLLSIIQAVFVILFFTAGHRDQNSSAVAPGCTMQSQANNTPSVPPSGHGPLLSKGQMITYKATEVDGKFKWQTSNPEKVLVADIGNDMKIKKEGHYFLTLQGWINTNTCSTGLLGKVAMLSAEDTLKFTSNLPPNEVEENESLTHLDIIYMPSIH